MLKKGNPNTTFDQRPPPKSPHEARSRPSFPRPRHQHQDGRDIDCRRRRSSSSTIEHHLAAKAPIDAGHRQITSTSRVIAEKVTLESRNLEISHLGSSIHACRYWDPRRRVCAAWRDKLSDDRFFSKSTHQERSVDRRSKTAVL
jgi:hypothetical protein